MKYRPPCPIVGKNTEHKMVLLGELGPFCVGTMWVKEESKHKERPGYASAPEMQVDEWSLEHAV